MEVALANFEEIFCSRLTRLSIPDVCENVRAAHREMEQDVRLRNLDGHPRAASLEEVIAVNEIKSEAMTTDEQEVVHYADAKKGGLSTLCGITIPPAKESMIDKEITCATCRGQLNWLAIPNRPRMR
jgi:hypothetical protein